MDYLLKNIAFGQNFSDKRVIDDFTLKIGRLKKMFPGVHLRFFIIVKVPKPTAKALINPKVPTGFSGTTSSGPSGLSGELSCGSSELSGELSCGGFSSAILAAL
jgi:hypothetical protein